MTKPIEHPAASEPPTRRIFSRAEFLAIPLADSDLAEDLKKSLGGTTDDLGPIR